MLDILKKIFTSKLEAVKKAKQYRDFASLRHDVESNKQAYEEIRNFENSLHEKIVNKQPGIIAEIKKASPSQGIIRKNFQPAIIASSYEIHGAACLSVLTDTPFFHGTSVDLKEARNACKLPVLCKDFIFDPYQIYEARSWGADAILLIATMLDYNLMQELEDCAHKIGMAVLVEIHNNKELDPALKLKTALLGINNRNLHTFKTNLQTTLNLISHIPTEKLIITESGIATKYDVKRMRNANIQAFLIGEVFMRAIEPGSELKRLFS